MGNYKILKIIDLVLQLAAIAVSWIYLSLQEGFGTIAALVVCYLAIGAVQLISFFGNMWYLPKHLRGRLRNWYGLSIAILAVMCIIAIVMKAGLLMLNILFYATPILAIAYIIVTISELFKIYRDGRNTQ